MTGSLVSGRHAESVPHSQRVCVECLSADLLRLLLCAVQVCKMILKIDDIIQPSQYE